MELQLIAGSANTELAQGVAAALGVALARCEIVRFPDDELHVRLCESARGRDVYLLQPTSPPADGHLFELLLLADAAHRAGAARITAVVPYLGYARQDRRGGREAVALRVVAGMLDASPVERLVVLDPHTAAIEGSFSMPVEAVTAVPLLARAVGERAGRDAIIVAPDLGAAKLAERYAETLDAPVAIVRKTRVSGSDVKVSGVSGDVERRAPIIVDDMISTGGTIEAAAGALLAAGAMPEITVVATHGLFVGPAFERLRRLGARRFIVTDSVPRAPATAFPVETVGVAALLADAVRRLRGEEPAEDLIAHV